MRPNLSVRGPSSVVSSEGPGSESRRPSAIERRLARSGGGPDRKPAVPSQAEKEGRRGQGYTRLSFLGGELPLGGNQPGPVVDFTSLQESEGRRRSAQHFSMEPLPPPMPPARSDDPFLPKAKQSTAVNSAGSPPRRNGVSPNATLEMGASCPESSRGGSGRLTGMSEDLQNPDVNAMLQGTHLSGTSLHLFRMLLHQRVDAPLQRWDDEMVQRNGALYGRDSHEAAERVLRELLDRQRHGFPFRSGGGATSVSALGLGLPTPLRPHVSGSSSLGLGPKQRKESSNTGKAKGSSSVRLNPVPKAGVPSSSRSTTPSLVTTKTTPAPPLTRPTSKQSSTSFSSSFGVGAGSLSGTLTGMYSQLSKSVPLDALQQVLPANMRIYTNQAVEEMDDVDFTTKLEEYIAYKLARTSQRIGIFLRRSADRFRLEFSSAAEPEPEMPRRVRVGPHLTSAPSESAEERSRLEAGLTLSSVAQSANTSSFSPDHSEKEEEEEEGEEEEEEEGLMVPLLPDETWEEKVARVRRLQETRRGILREKAMNDEEWLNSSIASPRNIALLSGITGSTFTPPSANSEAGRDPDGGSDSANPFGGGPPVRLMKQTSSSSVSLGGSIARTTVPCSDHRTTSFAGLPSSPFSGPLSSIGGSSPLPPMRNRYTSRSGSCSSLPSLDPIVDHLPQFHHMQRLVRLIHASPEKASWLIHRFLQKVQVMRYRQYQQALQLPNPEQSSATESASARRASLQRSSSVHSQTSVKSRTRQLGGLRGRDPRTSGVLSSFSPPTRYSSLRSLDAQSVASETSGIGALARGSGVTLPPITPSARSTRMNDLKKRGSFRGRNTATAELRSSLSGSPNSLQPLKG